MLLARSHDPATTLVDSHEARRLAASDQSESLRCFHHFQRPQVQAALSGAHSASLLLLLLAGFRRLYPSISSPNLFVHLLAAALFVSLTYILPQPPTLRQFLHTH